jgi:hypothetical protein
VAGRGDAHLFSFFSQKPLNFAAAERSLSPSVSAPGWRMAPCEQAAVESMPIIIDEIVISVEVTDRISAGVGSPSTEPDTQFIVERCVERVLAILREREERTP